MSHPDNRDDERRHLPYLRDRLDFIRRMASPSFYRLKEAEALEWAISILDPDGAHE